VESTAITITDAAVVATDPTAPGNKGLKSGAIGYVSNLVIAVASTAPAYSLAATLGFVVAVAGVGVHAPAVLLVSFIPILFVSVGYRFFNLADPDAGTTFAWVTRAFGPHLGWINGWAIFLADIIVMASLAEIASQYTFSLWNGHPHTWALIVGAVIWIAVMTWIAIAESSCRRVCRCSCSASRSSRWRCSWWSRWSRCTQATRTGRSTCRARGSTRST
jgi:hypothetical protein